MDDQRFGLLAFHVYAGIVEGQTHDGRLIPDWDHLTDKIREAWTAAAQAVIDNHDDYRPA